MRRLALLALTTLAAGLLSAPAAPAQAATTFRAVTITAADGVALKANVLAPDGAQKRPAIVFAASWSLNDAEYLVQAHKFADAGYIVLSYTPRGFWGSGGGVEVAGPEDIADNSTVLDWLLANTAADPQRIGVAGISYGAGIGLISAAHDPRIKAVAAMSTWTDLAESLYGNSARHGQAVALLKFAAQLTGHMSPGLKNALDRFFANQEPEEVRAWANVRSAATYIGALNRNAPAVLMANAYGDSIFPPNQLLDFYDRLTGPKRLELAPGDHAIAEGPGLFGLDNHVWTSVHRWFDTYIAGQSSGIEREDPVVLRVRGSGAVETAPTISAAMGAPVRKILGAPAWDANGVLGGQPGTWSRSIYSGLDTVAHGGTAMLSNGWDAITGQPPTAWLPAVSRPNAMVWTSSPVTATAKVRGKVQLHTTVAGAGLLVAYLYDVDGLGNGKLISHAPWAAGTADVDLTFPATAYDVPAGHRYGLVIDTEDPLYLDTNTLTPVKFTGSVTNPSHLTLPLK